MKKEGENPVPHYWDHVMWVFGFDARDGGRDAFLNYADQITLDGQVEKIRVPFLITHGENDRQIPAFNAHMSYDQAVNSPKRHMRMFTRADFEVEGMVQTGTIRTGTGATAPQQKVSAWFVHADAGYSLPVAGRTWGDRTFGYRNFRSKEALAAAASLASGLPFLIVRKEAKAYGTGNKLEGVFEPGERVFIAEYSVAYYARCVVCGEFSDHERWRDRKSVV